MTELGWLHSLSMYPAGSPEACAKAQIASNRLAFTFLKYFLAHDELCSCPWWMKHLPYSWNGARRMRGVFHICMILQISENSVAVKNIISKIMMLSRREISLSTHKGEKKILQLFPFYLQFCPTLLKSLYFVGHTLLFLWPFPIGSWKRMHFFI